MLTPFDHQITGAQFLAARSAALLADEPRVGKTGAAIRACDYRMARRVLVVTTASGRPVWAHGFREWGFPRKVQTIYSASEPIGADTVILGWAATEQIAEAMKLTWDVVLFDESHYAKNPTAKRTKAAYGRPAKSEAVWCLTGTPVPNAPNDLWPMLNALAPERIDGMSYDQFTHRYCVVVPRNINGRRIDVVKGGKNLDELSQRLDGFWLRRTQQDVGIRKPIFSILPVHVDKLPPELAGDDQAQAILEAAETGDTRSLEMHLGPIRRLTGMLKAPAVAAAASEMLNDNLDKLVLMAWHTDVIDYFVKALAGLSAVKIDGRDTPKQRDAALHQFQAGRARVFVGQMQAAGEAIDLSASSELWFPEWSFVPKDMSQAALRITNHSQKRQPLVRVCALEGSLDVAFTEIMTRKVETIHQLLERRST